MNRIQSMFPVAAVAWIASASLARPPQQADPAAAPAQSGNSGADIDTQLVNAFETRYGVHPGFRANHAKGILVEGRFVPTTQAAELCRSPIFAGPEVPVTVRFSDAGGIPDLHDGSPTAKPHGMSIKFHLPGGVDSDIVTNTFPFFPVATPEDFRDLQLAEATTAPGAPRSAQLQEFLRDHPSVEKAVALLKTPVSFADAQYYGVDAFVFINKAGARQPFRYTITPEALVFLDDAEAQSMPADFLIDELPDRLARGPVTFHLTAQLAAPGDQTKDPTVPWPAARPVVDLGTLTLERAVPESDLVQKQLLFTPGRLTDGIVPSDDPLIAARDGSYAVSYERRSPTLATEQFRREAAAREQSDRAASADPPKGP